MVRSATRILILAGLTAIGASAGLAELLPSRSSAAEQLRDPPGMREGRPVVPQEFEKAGVCARCHVVSVLEWGLSRHLDTEANCVECHGPSLQHVTDERNEAKPDRLPHGDEIARKTCLRCHDAGCPATLGVEGCQQCHHVHALIHPAHPPAAKDDRLQQLLARWEQFQQRMASGERHVQRQDWKAAQTAYREALKILPDNRQARLRLAMCSRRLDPRLPGFQAVSERVHVDTGLPVEVRVAGLGTVMVLVPPGEIDLGCDARPDCRPVHTVRVREFYLGRCEVTQGEWTSVMGTNPSAHQGREFPAADRMPVEQVSWNDCQEFLRRLNQRVPGGGFRLPSEAEWEYACCAGSPANAAQEGPEGGTPKAGDTSARAWIRDNSIREGKTTGPFLNVDAYAPRPVGTKRPNAWGLCDMQGNVWEWCSSLWRPYPYEPADGRESLAEPGLRILRGGGFADSADFLDPRLRHAERPQRRLRWNGLRLARTVPTLEPQKEAGSAQ